MSAYLFIHLVDHLQLSFSWFLLQFIDLCSVFLWLLNQFHLVVIYWLVCRDRNSPLCHIRVSLTSCIGAGHIIFFAGIDFTENQVTLWTSCSCNCLFVCLYLIWSSFLMIWRLTDPSSDSFSCSCSFFFFFPRFCMFSMS